MTDPVNVDDLARDRQAKADALEAATELLVQAIASNIRAGHDVNISAIAAASGLARQTLYNRLDELGVDR